MAGFSRTQQIAHRIGERGLLALKITSGEVRLRAVDGDEARIRATFSLRAASDQEADELFNAVQLRVEAGRGRLALNEPDEGGSIARGLAQLLRGRSSRQLDIEIELPRQAELQLEVVSADVQADGLLGSQRYSSVSGDLYLTDMGGVLRVRTVSGDVTMRARGAVSLQTESVSGDLSVVALRYESIAAHSVSGDVELEGSLAPGGRFSAETVSGDLSIGLAGDATFEVRGLSTDISSAIDHRIEGHADRRRVIVGNGEPRFVFSSMSGDIEIHRARRVDQAGTSAATSAPATSPAPAADAVAVDEMSVLQALERGEIDVDEATRRLGGGSDHE
jgi:hypothetical protein